MCNETDIRDESIAIGVSVWWDAPDLWSAICEDDDEPQLLCTDAACIRLQKSKHNKYSSRLASLWYSAVPVIHVMQHESLDKLYSLLYHATQTDSLKNLNIFTSVSHINIDLLVDKLHQLKVMLMVFFWHCSVDLDISRFLGNEKHNKFQWQWSSNVLVSSVSSNCWTMTGHLRWHGTVKLWWTLALVDNMLRQICQINWQLMGLWLVGQDEIKQDTSCTFQYLNIFCINVMIRESINQHIYVQHEQDLHDKFFWCAEFMTYILHLEEEDKTWSIIKIQQWHIIYCDLCLCW